MCHVAFSSIKIAFKKIRQQGFYGVTERTVKSPGPHELQSFPECVPSLAESGSEFCDADLGLLGLRG